MEYVSSKSLNRDSLFEILKHIHFSDCTKVGCKSHDHFLTKKLIAYYLIIRANIIAKSYNKINNKVREEIRKHRKNLNYK